MYIRMTPLHLLGLVMSPFLVQELLGIHAIRWSQLGCARTDCIIAGARRYLRYIFVIHYLYRKVWNSSVGFSLYLTFFLLYLYNYLSGCLFAWVKGNGASFAAGYSPDLHFASVCVNYNYFTILVTVKQWNAISYYFPNFHVVIFNLCQSTYTFVGYALVWVTSLCACMRHSPL